MWRYLKKLVIGIVASLLLVLGSGPALASGVPLYQYDATFSPSGSIYYYYGTWIADWTTNYSSWGAIYTTYYKVVNTSSWLNSPQAYSGGAQITVTFAGVDSGGVMLQGTNDGTNWTTLGSWSNVYVQSGGTSSTYQAVFGGTYSQIRTVVFVTDPNHGYGINGTISLKVYNLAADQQTAQTAADNATNAMNAANSANSAAQAAQTAAQNAENGTNTIINSYLSTTAGVVQDSSGTVLTASRAAQLAANQADTDIKSAQSALQSSINSVQSSVTNITNYLPPTLNKVSGYNGATATSATSFKVALDYSNATDYQYQIDGGSWSGWNSLSGYNGYITVSGLSTSGMHTITVKVRNGATGPTAQGSMNVFKL